MKRLLFILLFSFSFPLLHAAKISGSFSPKDTVTVMTLLKMNYDTREDSTLQRIKVKPDKTFDFTITLKEPAIFCLEDGQGYTITYLLVKPADVITFTINNGKVSVTGSPETQYLIEYETLREKTFARLLKPTYDSARAANKAKDKEKLEYWNKQQTIAQAQYKAELSQWSRQAFFLNSLAAIHHSLRWNADTDVGLMDSMVAAYQKNYSGYTLTRQLENKVNRTKRVAFGVQAPNFLSTTEAGAAFALKEVKSNYILLDFWASWCGPCRMESPTLVRLYKEYQEKGFTIISVSIDDEQSKWLKAIKKDHYTWTNVSDLKGWQSPSAVLYGVTSIPASFLLDKEGRIIAKNLRGQELENKLKELMK